MFTTAACGDDGGGGDAEGDQEYVDAAVAGFEEGDLPFGEDATECLAAGLVRAFGGAEAFEEAGVEPEDMESEDFDPVEAGLELDEDGAEVLAGTFEECDISMADLLVTSIEGEGADVGDDLRDCLEENVEQDAWAEVFTQAIVDPDSFENEPPEEFTTLFLELASECPDLIEISG